MKLVKFKKTGDLYVITGYGKVKDPGTRNWEDVVHYQKVSTTMKEVPGGDMGYTRDLKEFWERFELAGGENTGTLDQIVTIFYGMSGALKSTTINHMKSVDPNLKSLDSLIKPWKSLEKDLPMTSTDLNFALLHLMRCKDYGSRGTLPLLVERGVTDPLFYHTVLRSNEIPKEMINRMVKEEYTAFDSSVKVKKILLVQKDMDLIQNHILKEPTRGTWFKSVEEYLGDQEKYINFTKTYNTIDEVREIWNIEDYKCEFLS